jgi:DNA polymerase
MVVPMYHPAAALHQGSLRPVIENDFALLPKLIAEHDASPEIQGREEKDEEEPKQLSLF